MIIQVTPEEEMRAYDRLPKTLRQALRESGEQFSALQLFKMWRAGEPCVELIALVKQEDRWR
jgi:hypothetical protein